MTDDSEERGRIALDMGYAITIGQQRKVLRLQAPNESASPHISLSASGPAVEISAAALALATTGDVTIDCDRFSVKTQRDVSMVAGGNIAQIAGGRCRRTPGTRSRAPPRCRLTSRAGAT